MSGLSQMLALNLLPQFVQDNLGWWAFGLIVVVGLLVLGLKDVLRFSWKRVWAISSVCFSESVRRRVLWIAPVAILGVIVVSQLQKPFDEQDAIRQTTKICLFATGLVVAMTTIILACTNLPREIESRVIYTVVTKPTTRLEIVLGKVVGFARVSFTILLIMGLFTYGYLLTRAWGMQREIAQRLDAGVVPEAIRPTLAHYREAGLLTAKTLTTADQMQIFARMPDESTRRYMWGSSEQDALIPFDIAPQMLVPAGTNGQPGERGVMVVANVGYERVEAPKTAPESKPTTSPTTMPYMGPFIIPPEERGKNLARKDTTPNVTFAILDEDQYSIGLVQTMMGGTGGIPLTDPTGKEPALGYIPPALAAEMARHERVYVQIVGTTPDTQYFLDGAAVELHVPTTTPGQFTRIAPARDPQDPQRATQPMFRGRSGNYGQQLRGAADLARAPIAIYRYRDADIGDVAEDGSVPFELRMGIERSDDAAEDTDDPTIMLVEVINRDTGAKAGPIRLTPESGRPAFFDVPAAGVAGGNFDVLLRNNTQGHFAGLNPASLQLVQSRQHFVMNLSTSLLILWLMSVLVIAVSIFSSTFLSWPIAVVLTLVILLGHWGVQQISDSLGSEMGNQVATDLGFDDAARARVVSSSVNALSTFLKTVAVVLPDISKFPAMEHIERGESTPLSKMIESLVVTFGFGVPLIVLSYVFLKNKEVAP
jgi:ABC-type transport system involved in multi-copper enzyme maturation permease subunit